VGAVGVDFYGSPEIRGVTFERGKTTTLTLTAAGELE
jgi:hypothetical protein